MSADRNLLFGILALQMDFISRDQLVAAMHAWMLDKGKLALKQFQQAETPLRESLTLYQKYQPQSPMRFDTESLLGAALAGQKRFAEAETALLAAYQGMSKMEAQLVGGYRQLFHNSLSRLVSLYEASERPDEASRWRKELDERKKGVK